MWRVRRLQSPAAGPQASTEINALTEDSKESIAMKKDYDNRCLKWINTILKALPSVMFGIFTIVFTIQQNSASNATREQDQRQADELNQKSIFENYIDDVSQRLLLFRMNLHDKGHLQHIRIKTLTSLRYLDPDRKREIIFFLYENELIRADAPPEFRVNLHGANLKDVKFIHSSELDCELSYLYLPGVFASNILFSGCKLSFAVFNNAIMSNSRFINSNLDKAHLVATNLDEAHFQNSHLAWTNFERASLVRSTFLHGELQYIDFTNADLLGSNIPDTAMAFRGHIFLNARYPDGTFKEVNSFNLVQDGGAEEGVSTIVSNTSSSVSCATSVCEIYISRLKFPRICQ